MGVIEPKKLCQITIVVKDLERVAKNYAEMLGVEMPPIGVSSPYEESHTRFKGEPTPTVVRMCNFNMGQVVLELLETDEYPSTWKDFLDTHGQAVHNIGFMTTGGPNNSTLFYSLYLYQNAFQFNKMGYASAMAWVLLVISLIIIMGLFKGLGRFSDQ